MSTSVVGRLEEAIVADRDDPELYLVLADELQARGDPRGELMVMQQQIPTIANRKERHALQARCDAWIAEHDLLGPLRAFAPYGRGRRADITWRFGYLRCLEIAWGVDARDDTPASAEDTLAAILAHPSARFLAVLVVGPAPGDDGRMSMQCLIDAIAASRPGRAALRTLHVGRITEWQPERTETGDIAATMHALPRLEKLVLEAGRVRVGALALPALRELRIVCGALDAELLDELCAIRCAKLAELARSSFARRTGAKGIPTTSRRACAARCPTWRKVRAHAARPDF